MFIYFLFLLCLASPWSLIEGLTVLSHPEIQLKHSKNHYNHTQIKSCEAPAYHCEEKYDCVYMHNTTFQKCGLNHIWLHVEHNVLSVPLSAQKDADECDCGGHRVGDAIPAAVCCGRNRTHSNTWKFSHVEEPQIYTGFHKTLFLRHLLLIHFPDAFFPDTSFP